jgi:two-component system alkaline phosphatase synthesis response regulator PhoP
MNSILMIEDDAGLVRVIGDRLKAEGFSIDVANDGITGLRKALEGEYDILLVDLMLPGAGGFDVIREIRGKGRDVPIIILSAKFQLSDKVSGLRLGADDYMVKPFDFDELLARIEANLRRKNFQEINSGEPEGDSWLNPAESEFSFGDCTVDFRKCELRKKGEPVTLSNIEFRLLVYLIVYRERVVSNDELLEKVWKYDDTISTRTLYVHIAWLRKKIAREEKAPPFIKTVRGIGYRFVC